MCLAGRQGKFRSRKCCLRPFILWLSVVSCTGVEPTPSYHCVTMSYPSVNLKVVDATGSLVRTATATYEVDGGLPVSCDRWSEDEITCGSGLDGHFTVNVEAPGFHPASESIYVERTSDGCQPFTQSMTIILAEEAPPTGDTGT